MCVLPLIFVWVVVVDLGDFQNFGGALLFLKFSRSYTLMFMKFVRYALMLLKF